MNLILKITDEQAIVKQGAWIKKQCKKFLTLEKYERSLQTTFDLLGRPHGMVVHWRSRKTFCSCQDQQKDHPFANNHFIHKFSSNILFLSDNE